MAVLFGKTTLLGFYCDKNKRFLDVQKFGNVILGSGESDENNLLYVAVTRAKNALQITNTVKSVLKQAGVS